LEVHCKLGCNFPGTFAAYVLSIISDLSVQLDTSKCGYPFIKHVLIQSVYEAVTCHCLPARQFVHTAILNELTMASQFVTAHFKPGPILPQSGCRCRRRKLGSRYACGFECSLLFCIKMIELLLDHLLDAFGHPDLYIPDIDYQLPTSFALAYQFLRDK